MITKRCGLADEIMGTAKRPRRSPTMVLRSGEGSMATSDRCGRRFESRAASAPAPTRRYVLGMGAGAALAPLMAAAAPRLAPQVEAYTDPTGLEAAVDALVQKTGVKPTD